MGTFYIPISAPKIYLHSFLFKLGTLSFKPKLLSTPNNYIVEIDELVPIMSNLH